MRMMTAEKYNDKPTGSVDGRETTDAAIDTQPVMLDHREELILRLGRDNVALRIERDAALASESAAYARGVHVAAKALQSVADNWDCGHMESRLCNCRPLVEQWVFAADEVRALADTPPAPVVGVKPLVWTVMGDAFYATDPLFEKAVLTDYPEKYDAERAARIRAALLPQAEGGE